MKTFEIFISTLIFAILVIQSFTQEVHFEYDDSGNRIARTIVWEDEKESPKTFFDTSFYKYDEINEEDIVKHSANIGEQLVNIYPNPTKGTFKVGFEGWQKELEVFIQLHSLKGKLIFEKKVENPVTNLNIINQPDGTYILTITIGKEKETWKIIKK